MRTLTAIEVAELLDEESGLPKVNGWLARGDGVAVYRNEDMSSRGLGNYKFASFGSSDAQFETTPPQQLPDFDGEINWRFQLHGTYRGDPLPVPERDPNGPDRVLNWVCAVDNYEPTRSYQAGALEVWEPRDAVPEEGRSPRPLTLVVADADTLKDAHNAVYLVDDGYKVVPWYVTGWDSKEHPVTRIFLHQFPTNYDADREPIMRGDRGEQVNFDTWRLGPRRAYHLKVNKEI